ncbi:hypothetical protein [Natronobacterium gregoryi]|uniref:S-layer protein n=2 Tax=Natronobacterium gregoryi TaxID=44930 RepID=L0AGL8_NATGS|nr:hypothetical protein [Natronobacterium gregoryi]AFZ73043.1 hypothetical protein Natgr_1858 [Natronobacterium gregoryi SP2]ELY70851.1 S-layer protein [Natronobacterium gregoryi SP2]PLK20432.1 S-layer protein [Natronobacterium gregoryi SP2]SFI62911.1 hypothetical protein SAMN05443661_102223 [Natronobacterium gregoryi]
MSQEPELPDNVISGAYHRLGVVDADELGDDVLDGIKAGEQEVTYIGNTHDGFEADVDWSEFDVNPSAGQVTQQFRTHVGYTLTTNTFATPGLEQLENAGLVDTSTGQLQPKQLEGAMVSEVYENDPRHEDSPIETIVWPNVDITIDGLEYAEDDAGELPLEVTVNDHPYFMSFRDEVDAIEIGVETLDAESVTDDGATLNGELTTLENADDADVSFAWGQGSLDNETTVETLNSTGTFDATLTDLEPDTQYIFQAVAESSYATDKGDILAFTTDPES